MSTPTVKITYAGISAPSFSDVLSYLQDKYQSIYGSDVYLGNDSQDGQWIAVIAQCISDCNAAAIAVYNNQSPATAQGAGLSSNVKINGISRNAASYSTVDIVIVGQAGTQINNGVVSDINNISWSLPALVTIPTSGTITETATCQTIGAVNALPNTVNVIATPTLGWQSANNASAASIGAPVETDAQLRQRQTYSVALPSNTVIDGTTGAVLAVPGVTRQATYENNTGTNDSNGVTPYSISLVVEGGDANAIGQAICDKKGPGCGTYGTTTVIATSAYGIPQSINFFRPTYRAITVAISLKALSGYSSTIGAAIQQAVSDYINNVAIGGGPAACVEWDSAITAAKSVTGYSTFKITALTLTGPSGAGTPDVPLSFNHASTCSPSSVVLTVS